MQTVVGAIACCGNSCQSLNTFPCLYVFVDSLTRWEQGMQTYFLRSHKASNLLHLTMSDKVLEDNVIGEVYSPDWLEW
jgi:hypothetical protein